MADVIYKRGPSDKLNDVIEQDGQILVTTDQGEMYIDLPNGRKKITDTNKVDKDGNKVLSTNDFTKEYKEKLDNIEDEATKTIVDTTYNKDVNAQSLNPQSGVAVAAAIAQAQLEESDVDLTPYVQKEELKTINNQSLIIGEDGITNIVIEGGSGDVNLDGYATETYVQEAIQNKVDKIPGMGLSTNDFDNYNKNTLIHLESNAVLKEEGKGLSTCDYTTWDKNQLTWLSEAINEKADIAELPNLTVGNKTEFGGEIFSNYSNNYALSQYATAMGTNCSAGIKGYRILSNQGIVKSSSGSNRLAISIAGKSNDFSAISANALKPETNSVVSFQIINCYNFAGQVVYKEFRNDAKGEHLIMLVDLVDEYNAQTIANEYINNTERTDVLWLPYYPGAGIVSIGDSAFAVGNTTHANYQGAFAAGRNNLADGKYSFVAGKDNKVGHASAAFGTGNNVLSQGSFSSGANNEVKGIYSFAHGLGLIVNSAKKAVFGFFNDVTTKHNDKYSIFSIGNGTSNTARSNALDVYSDGSAELATQGTSDNSIVINSKLRFYTDIEFNEAVQDSLPEGTIVFIYQ